jgi:hypothetical protein
VSSLIQVDRKEWEAFLSKLSELEKKYELVLRELDEAHQKLQALEKPPNQQQGDIMSGARTPAEEQPVQKPIGLEKRGLLTGLKTKLQSLRAPPILFTGRQSLTPNAPANYAWCSRCGRTVSRPIRFCEYCGADFGGLVCSCGRQLSSSDKFCDHCGRRLGDAS